MVDFGSFFPQGLHCPTLRRSIHIHEIIGTQFSLLYIDETSRLFGTRLKVHNVEAEKALNKKHSRSPETGIYISQESKINRQPLTMTS